MLASLSEENIKQWFPSVPHISGYFVFAAITSYINITNSSFLRGAGDNGAAIYLDKQSILWSINCTF